MESQPALAPEKLVFIDETWASTNLARRHGRAACGERLVAAVPYGHWKTTTFVAGLRLDRVVAPLVLDGPINAQAFEAYVEQFLAPTLRPGDIVIMDNLSSHKGPRISALIEAVGAKLLYLPPYSPDLNPIEKLFAKLKALLRKAAERTVEGLWQAIGECLDHFSPRECANYFSASGYEPTRTESALSLRRFKSSPTSPTSQIRVLTISVERKTPTFPRLAPRIAFSAGWRPSPLGPTRGPPSRPRPWSIRARAAGRRLVGRPQNMSLPPTNARVPASKGRSTRSGTREAK
jgi:transposase